MRHQYLVYDNVVAAHADRIAAGCLAHARRYFSKLGKSGTSEMVTEALKRIATIYRTKRQFGELAGEDRLRMRQSVTKPLREELNVWLQLERARVLDGGATAKALSYSLNAWTALTRNLVGRDAMCRWTTTTWNIQFGNDDSCRTITSDVIKNELMQVEGIA